MCTISQQGLKAGLIAVCIFALASFGQYRASAQPATARKNPELPCRPAKEVITPAQAAFWNYIETFNRLPDNPTELQRQIFATRGDANPFRFISTSPTSVFADVAGMKAHRVRFAQRYPWVQKLLDKEKITLEVDEEVFKGSAKEIISRCPHKYDTSSLEYYKADQDRSMFSKRFLETLLALDYIFACGSAQDRMDGLNLLEQVVRNIMLAGIDSPEWSARAAELEIPAVVEIAIPIANEFPDDVPEKLVRFLPCMFPGKETAAACIYTYKWTLRVKAFAKWDATIDLNQVLASNVLVTHGLLHYTIYWHHLQKNARPDADSNGQAVQALFDEIYGKQAAAKEHKKYLALLNAAYPPEAKASTPQSSNFE